MTEEEPMVWQPVMLVVSKRIECGCGAKAVFVVLDDNSDASSDYGYTGWCQDCWRREQESME
jgi:hypothetical protein